MVTSINVRNYSEGDEEQIVELFQVAFNGWPRFDLESSPLDYWKWKYGRGYEKDVVVAEVGGKIVGAFHSVPCKFKLNNGNYNATLGADIAVSPDYQGMGLYNKMRGLVDQTRKKHGVDLHYAINENPKLIEKRRKDHKNNPDIYPYFQHKLTRYIRIKNIDQYLDENPVENQLIKKIGYKVLKRLSETITANKVRNRQYDVVKVNKYEECLETYWKQYKDNYSFIFNKDEEYLRWRYFDNRSSRYEAVALLDEHKCVGYCIMKINTGKDTRQGYITELLASNQDATDQLIRYSLDYFDDNKVNLVLTLAFNKHPQIQCYRSNGFIPYNTYSLDLTLYNRVPSFQRELGKVRVEEAYFSYGDLDYV